MFEKLKSLLVEELNVDEKAITMEAELAKSLLQSAGIYAELENEVMSTFYPMAVPYRLMVCEDDLEQAKTLLIQR